MAWRIETVLQPWGLVARGIITLLGQAVEVPPGRTLSVGRSPSNDVCVPSPEVRRRTAELRRDEQGMWLTELYLNSSYALTHAHPALHEARTPTCLQVDDAFRVGEFGFVLTPWFVVPAYWLECDGGAIWRLAQAAQMGRDWGTLPALADALEEAGCAEEDLLRHFREVDHKLRHCAALMRLLAGMWVHRQSRGRAQQAT